MARLGLEQLVTTPSTLNYLTDTAYDYTKWNVGKGLIYNAGSTAVDKYIMPQFDAIRPMEESTAFAVAVTAVHSFSPTIDYVFGTENSAAAAATRRTHLWTVNKKTGVRSWNGFITLTLATATVHTVRDYKVEVKNETTNTVTVSGTTVTGSSTTWATNGVAVGARIGFGSTDPTQISTWYRVTAVANTSITIATTGPTLGSPTAYVIQEFRQVYLATNATNTNGGIHYAKGVSIEDFTSGGTTIAISVATDAQKAVYWLKDASTQTNLVAGGMALDLASATATSLTCYVIDLVSAGNYKFFTYNLHAALTVASGASTSAWLIATGNNPFTGTGVQTANLTLATAAHGTGNGVKSLYFTTTSTARWYRVPVTQITTTSTNVFSSPSDNIIEVSPGGASTFAATGALTTVCYMSDCDMFVVGTTHTGGVYSYVSQYVASGAQFTKMFGRDYKYLEQSLKDNGHPTIFSNQATTCLFHTGGSNLIYVTKTGTTITTNEIYIMAFGADWDYAATSSGRLISPQITTANAAKYYRIFMNGVDFLGTTALGKTTEPFRIWARTANITSDATTGWTVLDETNDLSGFAGASSIQFAIDFKTIGESCLPTRVLGLNLSYEDTTTDSHYALSVAKSSVSSKIFAFWFKTAFGGTVPSLTITLYNADTGGLIMSDTTVAHSSGTWEKMTNNGSWSAYDTNDRSDNLTWIRYTPTSLSDNVKVAAYLTQT